MRPAEVHLIAAARPNFMKVAPAYHALRRQSWCRPVLVHTGQHYDEQMSAAFLRDLELPQPDIHLGVGSGSHAEQTAKVMVAYEKVCLERPPTWVIVVGDVNSTMACTLAAKKLCLPVAHLEAGLRSRDRTMPEEINGIVTDAISDLLWTPSPDGDANLLAEGVPAARIERIGNIMIDSYKLMRPRIEATRTRERFALAARGYAVVTLHRPANVDQPGTLKPLLHALATVASCLPLVFPMHPRTRSRIKEFGLEGILAATPTIHLCEPLGYVDFMGLVREAGMVLTDSGGVQEETTYLGIPCLTLRDTTERPVTVSEGSNRLIKLHELREAVAAAQAAGPRGRKPDLWDGRTAERLSASLRRHLEAARADRRAVAG
ncbi:MAG: UDP-N-acetylglucosamine 2-epimerase (non-hydrolyzing) [Alphaproteobacteria bacterium]|nr:UDP-N-acetylglucosamine 2-epimerase (non-hydrolyzing) [Alphaproteobacteria bacterium]